MVTDPPTFFVALRVEPGPDRQARFGFRVADEVDDGHAVEQGATAPIFGNEAEYTMLDFVPLPCAGGKGETWRVR